MSSTAAPYKPSTFRPASAIDDRARPSRPASSVSVAAVSTGARRFADQPATTPASWRPGRSTAPDRSVACRSRRRRASDGSSCRSRIARRRGPRSRGSPTAAGACRAAGCASTTPSRRARAGCRDSVEPTSARDDRDRCPWRPQHRYASGDGHQIPRGLDLHIASNFVAPLLEERRRAVTRWGELEEHADVHRRAAATRAAATPHREARSV